MKTVSLSELENSLGAYVRAAREGDTVIVTDGGAVVARLVPPLVDGALHSNVKPHHLLTPDERKALYHHPGPPLLQGMTSKELLDALREDSV